MNKYLNNNNNNNNNSIPNNEEIKQQQQLLKFNYLKPTFSSQWKEAVTYSINESRNNMIISSTKGIQLNNGD